MLTCALLECLRPVLPARQWMLWCGPFGGTPERCPKSGWFHVEHARKSAWWWLELRRTRCPLLLSFIVDMQGVPLPLTPRNNHVAGGKPIDLLCVTQSNTRKAAVQASHSIHHTIGCACQYVPVISRVIDCGKDLEDPVPNGFLCCCRIA